MHIRIKKSILLMVGVGLITPVFTQAQTLFHIMDAIAEVLDLLPPLAVGIAAAVFFWGVIKFIFSAGSVAAKDAGKSTMIWGVIALFFIVAVWGIVAFLGSVFGVGAGGSCPPPQIGPDSVSTC
jgi:hypothetical protein